MNLRPQQPVSEIDWKQLRKRLETAAAATQQGQRLSPEQTQKLLDDRARQLAQSPEAEAFPGQKLEIITFSIGEEHYALETRWVQEVLHRVDLTRVPGTPEFLAGVINHRGEILPVFDLLQFFGLRAEQPTDTPSVLVLGEERADMGVSVLALGEVTTIPTHEIYAPEQIQTPRRRQHVRGITTNALVLLDGFTLLRDPRLFIDQKENP